MLKFQTETLEGIDTALHGFYEQTDSGYKLRVDGLEDVSGLKNALNSERENNKSAKQRLKELDDERLKIEESRLAEKQEFEKLWKSEKEAKLSTAKQLEELTRKVAERQGDLLVKTISAELTTDAVEREIIERFAKDFLEYDGDVAKWTKDDKEIRATLSKFVRNKATGTSDNGNNKGSESKPSGGLNGSKAEQLAYIKDKFKL